MRRFFASATNAAQLGVRAPPAVLADVVEARREVFGVVAGNGRRSGRKWLRSVLRGPAIKAWYGLNFTDVLPNFITAEKEEVFSNEQQLNRVGKTRITGKMKPFTKPLVDTMLFEEGLEEVRAGGKGGDCPPFIPCPAPPRPTPHGALAFSPHPPSSPRPYPPPLACPTHQMQILEDLEFEDSDALLLPEELQRREALLASAEDDETRDAIGALFERIAAEREEQREASEEQLGGAAAGGEGDKAERKRRGGEFDFRRGWDDKRSAGDTPPPPPPEPAAAAAAAAAVPADAAAGADAAGAAELGAAADSAESPVKSARDPLSSLAAATVFSADPSKLTPEQFDAAYAAHCKERGLAEWEALQEIKDDRILGTLMKCVIPIPPITLFAPAHPALPLMPPPPPPRLCAHPGMRRPFSSRRACQYLQRAWSSCTCGRRRGRRSARRTFTTQCRTRLQPLPHRGATAQAAGEMAVAVAAAAGGAEAVGTGKGGERVVGIAVEAGATAVAGATEVENKISFSVLPRGRGR